MKKRHMIYIAAAVAATAAVSCSDWLDVRGMFFPESDGVEKRFEQSIEYNGTREYRVINVPTDSYKLYVFADSHIDGTTEGLDRFVADCNADPDAAPFSLCLGDLVNKKGRFDDFIAHTEPLATTHPLFVTTGNHDLYFGQWADFRERFHTTTYCFDVRTPSAKDLYICLDSGNGTLGRNQRKWLEDILKEKSESCRNIIVFTHTHFFKKDSSQETTSNFALEETYDLAGLFARYGVDLVLTGHDHYREDTYFKRVRYIILDALKDGVKNASYAVCTIGDTTEVAFVEL